MPYTNVIPSYKKQCSISMCPFFIFSWFLDGFCFLFFRISYLWSPFLKFSNIFSKKCKHLFISNDSWYFYLNQHYYCQIWICINWIISPLVSFCKKLCISFTMLLILSCKVIVSYDWIIWWLVSHKSVSYRKKCVYMIECFLLILDIFSCFFLISGHKP